MWATIVMFTYFFNDLLGRIFNLIRKLPVREKHITIVASKFYM